MNASGKWLVGGVIVLVVIGAGGVLINSNSKLKSQKSETAKVVESPTPTPEVVSGKITEVTVEASNYKFAPAAIKVKQGDTVRLIFKSTGGIHSLVIDQFGVQTAQLGEGEEEEVEFVADKIGTFEYYCSVGNHRAQGMKGLLVVE